MIPESSREHLLPAHGTEGSERRRYRGAHGRADVRASAQVETPVSRTGWAVLGVGAIAALGIAKKAKKRARRARKVYVEEVSSGSKPIEAVGTAVAAFVGFAAD